MGTAQNIIDLAQAREPSVEVKREFTNWLHLAEPKQEFKWALGTLPADNEAVRYIMQYAFQEGMKLQAAKDARKFEATDVFCDSCMEVFVKDECTFSKCTETGFNHSTCPNGCNDYCVDIDWDWSLAQLNERCDTNDAYIAAVIDYQEQI